jgi:hypothetical protein
MENLTAIVWASPFVVSNDTAKTATLAWAVCTNRSHGDAM